MRGMIDNKKELQLRKMLDALTHSMRQIQNSMTYDPVVLRRIAADALAEQKEMEGKANERDTRKAR